MNYKCLNCNTYTGNNFCSVCGQKTSTHRFSLKHFILHDFIHGVFHFDKGFFFTIKELFTRPGHSIREYVQGKRVKHFNAFTLLLIIIALTHFIGEYAKVKTIDLSENNKNNFEGFAKIVKEYAKIVVFIWIPLYAAASYVFFKNAKQNYSEHLVQTIYMIAGVLIIGGVFSIPKLFSSNVEIMQYLYVTSFFSVLSYSFWFNYQYFSYFKTKKNYLIIKCIILVAINFYITGVTKMIINEIGKTYFH